MKRYEPEIGRTVVMIQNLLLVIKEGKEYARPLFESIANIADAQAKSMRRRGVDRSGPNKPK